MRNRLNQLLNAFTHSGPGYDTSHPAYPYQDGEVTVLGPEIFASSDGQMISWKGENYAPQPEQEVERLRAEVAAARKYAAEMREFCSPHGVSVHYADQLIEVMDRAKAQREGDRDM